MKHIFYKEMPLYFLTKVTVKSLKLCEKARTFVNLKKSLRDGITRRLASSMHTKASLTTAGRPLDNSQRFILSISQKAYESLLHFCRN
jgi:hypothetical protein